MTDIPDIINTDIIDQQTDRFWDESTEKFAGLEPRPTLIISLPFLPGSPEEVQLTRMLQACKLEAEDYNVLQLETSEFLAWHQVRDILKPVNIIVLGISLEQLGINILLMPHQVSRFNERSWVVTSSLPDIIGNPDIKNHVWQYGLKPVFIDKVYS